MTNRATGIGSMPGDDFGDSFQTVLGEVGDLPYLPELPARGPSAAMVGRTLGLVCDLGADLQPAGWRLTDAAGADQRRARSLLAQDLDTVEELASGHGGRFKLQVVGPLTLAATVDRPRGEKVLGDYGARRDLAQALAEGIRDHVRDLRRRLGGASVVVQLDEPALPAVLAGAIPTASGFHRHRSVTASTRLSRSTGSTRRSSRPERQWSCIVAPPTSRSASFGRRRSGRSRSTCPSCHGSTTTSSPSGSTPDGTSGLVSCPPRSPKGSHPVMST